MKQTKLPHIQGDILFPLGLGFLNAAIYPLIRLSGRPHTSVHIAFIALIINFLSYAILKITPIEIQPMTIEGYIFPALFVSIGSFVINFLEMKAKRSNVP